MESLFDAQVNNRMIDRINKLTPDTKPVWGKMNVSQMLAHIQSPFEVSLGDKVLKRDFLGLIFGKIAKKDNVNPKPFKKGLPTSPQFKVRVDKDFQQEKEKLTDLVKRFRDVPKDELNNRVHPFFGKLTTDEWDMLHLKHLNHHLSQFGV